jgi:YbgC/YbaW family acyl-CoA thioester hydrolase
MSKIFSRTFRVRWSEINANGHVDIPGYLRYLVETAWDWGATSGLSIAENDKLGLVWVIRETEISFFRPLHSNDVFDFTIWLVKWRRVRGTRCFEIRLKNGGDLIAQGAQQIVTLDHKSLRPTPPPEHIIERFIIEDPRVIQQQRFPDIPNQPNHTFETQRRVEWRDLDPLAHVNNAIYAAYAEEASTRALNAMGWAPSGLKEQGLSIFFRRFHVQYKSPAFWGDMLNVKTFIFGLNYTGGSSYTSIRRPSDGEEICNCLLLWSLVDANSGAEVHYQ